MERSVPAPRSAGWLPRAFAVVAAVELVALEVLVARGGFALAPAAAIAAFDLALFAGLTQLFVGRRVGGLRALKPSLPEALGALLLGVCVHRLAAALVSVPSVGAVGVATAVALELCAIALASCFYARAVRAGAGRAVALEQGLASVLPRRLALLVAGELRVLAAAWAALRRRSLPQERGFGTMETSSYAQLAHTLMVLSCIELPVAHLVVHALSPGSALSHGLLLALHAYGLLWLLGDLRLLRATVHRAGPDGLHLTLGIRARAFVPYSLVTGVRVRPDVVGRALVLSPRDRPNIELTLDRHVEVDCFPARIRRADRLALYVDDPDALACELRRRSEAR